MEKIVIIGSGPAGYTAAIYCARADLKPVVISGQLPGGQLTQTTDIENFPGFPNGINGFELMTNLQTQAERFGTVIKYDSVEKTDFVSGGPQKITLGSGEVVESETVIIATGASPRWLGLEDEKRLQAKGVSACATCDGAFYRDVPVVVVGGGDSAMEEAMFLTKFASKVYVIHRRDKLRASKIMAERALANEKIEFIWDSVVTAISGENEVESVQVKNVKTEREVTIECKAYFAALGHLPATDKFVGIDKKENGFIDLKENSSKTNIDGVFAAGDCADDTYQQAITAAGMGCKAALDVEKWLEQSM
jgi:thioredoxin reductase (NADPH)